MAEGDIPMYERDTYPTYDEVDGVNTSNDEKKTNEGKCDMCTVHEVNKVMAFAVVILLVIVAVLTANLVIALDGEVVRCPSNMVYDNYRGGIATCDDPSGTDCSYSCIDALKTCICPADYLMDGSNCVPREQCGCYRKGYVGGVIADGTRQMAPDCYEECTCNSGTLKCMTTTCAQEATCKVVGDVTDCFCDEGYEGDGRTCVGAPFQDCYDISQRSSGGAISGDYTISLPGWTGGASTVNCNMTIDGGGWTVIQRHYLSPSRLDFFQNWASYRNGFGTPSQEFWIGNEKLFQLTNQRDYELRIDMVNRVYDSYYAKYDFFRISGESDKYRLIGLGGLTGTAGYDELGAVGLVSSYNMYFSTPDRDNDGDETHDCADRNHGGWWFNQCHNSNPNYGDASSSTAVGYWYSLPNTSYLVYIEMKIRPRVATG